MKFSRYYIVCLIILFCTLSFCGKQKNDFQEPQVDVKSLFHDFQKAIIAGDLDQVKYCIRTRVNQNLLFGNTGVQKTPINDAIDGASFSLECNFPDSDIRIEILKMMIRNGAKINFFVFNFGSLHYTALDKVLLPNTPQIALIEILLRHGAEINENTFKMAHKRNNVESILKILLYHQRLREKASKKIYDEASQAKAKKLLKKIMISDNPYILSLLIKAGLKITQEDLNAAKILNSKGIGRFLVKYFFINHLNFHIRKALKCALIDETINYIFALAEDKETNQLAILC